MNANIPMTPTNRHLIAPDPSFADKVQTNISLLAQVFAKWPDGSIGSIPQGYTYLSQFLVHETVQRQSVPNGRTWKVDLDSIYGDPKELDEDLRFCFSSATCTLAADLARDTNFQAVIPEFRNDDHLIIAQLHLLMQRFHNRVMDELAKLPKFAGVPSTTLFNAAQKFVTASFQKIVLEELLPALTTKKVANYYGAGVNPLFTNLAAQTALPYEMTHASLRYGHSMVRSVYRLNDDRGGRAVALSELFQLTGQHSKSAFAGIPIAKKIRWQNFFPSFSGPEQPDGASRINPSVTKNMSVTGKFSADVVHLNLTASCNQNLCSGQALATELILHGAGKLDVVNSLNVFAIEDEDKKEQVAALKGAGLWEQTPIWLFMLIDADCAGVSPTSGGTDGRLGPFGSVLLWEAIIQATQVNGNLDYPNVLNQFSGFGLPTLPHMTDIVNFTNPTS